jgi:hypothetical protein
VGIIFGYYRFARRHGLGFSSFRIRRENTLFAEKFKFQDLTFTGEAKLSDKSSLARLSAWPSFSRGTDRRHRFAEGKTT